MVIKYLNADELFKVAMNIEKQGIDFYQNAIDKSTDKKITEFLEFLVKEEERHYETFKKMDAEMQDIRFRPEGFDEEISQYLRSLVNSGVFENILPRSEWQNITIRDAVNIGIQVEKTSILFYSGILDITEEQSAKPALEKIIQEEKHHLVTLSNFWKELK
ncbi:MAG TPA: ferritin family protein [Candidatus Ratteibacteria bacterium]|nr:ferritin family protein [bacterium]HOQ82460.1 ferritin family protein [bacterium]HRS06745.1 ferritin family protein [Candidatus Ratteibacteria bacterium]HRV04832.1 ferritin family protein [Candidatus Ratteibacteria bacterium]